MTTLAPETLDAIGRLQDALTSPAIPPREAGTCARLVEKLQRPVRIGVFGNPGSGNEWLVQAILGGNPVPEGSRWPTMEIVHGGEVRATATLSDASILSQQGLPSDDLMARAPVFLRIEAPFAILRRMSFLSLATDDGWDEQLSALAWAARRTEIALWCTDDFAEEEADLWGAGPDKLKNHAYLVTTGGANVAALRARAGVDFQGVFGVPRKNSPAFDSADLPKGLDGLLRRLNADIDEAHQADVDAAKLFLHRFGQEIKAAGAAAAISAEPQVDPAPAPPPMPPAVPAGMPPKPPAPEPNPQQPQLEPVVEQTAPPPRRARAITRPSNTPEATEAMALISEPYLYLKRRARTLVEMLDWQELPETDWAGDVLAHCCETTEALLDRTANWPEDHAGTLELRQSLEEAWDVAVLLQVEGGEEQAQDAATLLLQLRGDFERRLAA